MSQELKTQIEKAIRESAISYAEEFDSNFRDAAADDFEAGATHVASLTDPLLEDARAQISQAISEIGAGHHFNAVVILEVLNLKLKEWSK